MSHSKRNTSRPVFTSHERALAKSNWGTSSARLHRDSFLPFGSCGLCLEIARDPVACPRGDIFCRECALANLLAQKRELKRADRARQDAEAEIARIRALEDEEERKRAVRDFEMTQAGLAVAAGGGSRASAAAPVAAVDGALGDGSGKAKDAGTKRKFALDDDELERIAKEDRVKARKAIEDDKASKPSLPSFWTPSLTPDAHEAKLSNVTKKGKSLPTCPSSQQDHPHVLSMQKLVSLRFDEEDTDASSSTGGGSGGGKQRICPSCRKTLSNASAPVMAKQCGHVLCHNCVKKFLVPSKRQREESAPDAPIACYVCDTPVSSKPPAGDAPKDALPPGLVALKSEGTGFSASGSSTVKKSHVAFQC